MARPSEVAPPGEPVDLTDAEAPDFLESRRVALIAFLTKGDAQLRERLAVVGAKLSAPGFAIGVIDIDRHRLVAEALGVKSTPMLMVFQEGELVDRLIGAPPAAVIEDVLRTRLA